ncbi:MAG: PEP/pyruvate-binding domain-containing protein [Polyangiaceae bacterium]
MPHRVREVLLVSSAYDAFLLEEDGPLTRRLFASFSELELTWAPRITHASTAEQAVSLLARRPFQMVIIASSLVNADGEGLARTIHDRYQGLPVVLLAFEGDVAARSAKARSSCFDEVFLWNGDAAILIAIVKLIEDALNVEHDVEEADVQVIVVVEDSVRTYSNFLTLLYPELLRQSRSLVAEGVNEWHRLLRIHARPKIRLASSFEEAMALCDHWPDNLMGVISDVAFPRGGRVAPDAGIELTKLLRQRDDAPPVLLQSTDASVAEQAGQLGVWFVDKNAQDFMHTLRRFLQEQLGFGAFTFLAPDGTPLARANNVLEMVDTLEHVSLDSILDHARKHDFSRWLKARSMFQIARHTRGVSIADFRTPERIRSYLQDVLREASDHDQAGVVTDLEGGRRVASNRFIRLGSGSIGGKARSIGFVSALLVNRNLLQRFPKLEFRIPKTVAIGVSEFDRFMANVNLRSLEGLDDPAVRRELMAIPLSDELRAELRAAWSTLTGPLAVRSSSLREDARFQPFAGVYATYMLPNNHPDPEIRFGELCRAIRAVYASMFAREARTYSAGHPHNAEEEKMAVVVQQLIGQQFGDRFYPHISGVAQSFNYYPIAPQRANDGLCVIALGLGQMVVGGGVGLRFSPAHPDVLPQFSRPEQVLRTTQRQFYALDMSSPLVDLTAEPSGLLRLYDLQSAEADGTLDLAASVYCAEDDAIRENLTLAGPRVLTFANVLRWQAIPLAEAIVELLKAVGDAMGSEVEIEFAVDMGDYGRSAPSDRDRMVPRLYVLQARPMAGMDNGRMDLDFSRYALEEIVVRSEQALGNGRMDDVRDVVYVRRNDLDSSGTRQLARELREVDHYLGAHGRGYVLIGPGRFGSSDPSLGIPVDWLHIAHARVIVEVPLRGERLESSQGTHFFHNITSARIGYLTASPQTNGLVDQAYLDALPAVRETELLRHVELDQPLRVRLDGRHGRALVLKPRPPSDSLPPSLSGLGQ